jgi:hypothetical protein
MPSKSAPFTPSSILFRPRLVEAPGTAPGSDRFITTAIYRHSRQAGITNISPGLAHGKGNGVHGRLDAPGGAEQPHNNSAGIPELSVANNGA